MARNFSSLVRCRLLQVMGHLSAEVLSKLPDEVHYIGAAIAGEADAQAVSKVSLQKHIKVLSEFDSLLKVTLVDLGQELVFSNIHTMF